MTYEVVISNQAEEDLRGIYEYIAFERRSPQNAAGQLDRLEKTILSLDTMPYKYRSYEREPWHSRGLRIMPVDNFVVLYIPDEERRMVTVVRVMYGGRDVENQLETE
ncbi:MAG: type II toxin-antitoxin system RelE/ParE family toxin [Erysipelotrichaceae bacterium]|nr:type II toxin-antitoxin system RelE/ParE family toxin [Erysipelotrichaceae bacterium]